MDAARLASIQAALNRTFGDSPLVLPCVQVIHAHIIYSHLARVIYARSLAPLQHQDFEHRVDSWVFPTITAYDSIFLQVKHADPYRDFITARFLWQELPGVQCSNLPDNALVSASAGPDGGTLIAFKSGSTGFIPAQGASSVPLTITVPTAAAEDRPQGYPIIRQICLSIPNQAGNHFEINTQEVPGNTTEVRYPFSNRDDVLRLCAVMPYFRFELRKDGQKPLNLDPWAYRLAYEPLEWGKKYGGWDLYESTTNTQVGSILRYAPKDRHGNPLPVHYGVGWKSTPATKSAVLSNGDVTGNLSSSRRMIVCAVMGVEGGPDAVTTYDGPKLSWGMNQWTGNGELQQILCYIYDFFPDAFRRCFGRYGLGVHFDHRSVEWTPGNTYPNPIIYRVPCCPSRAGLAALRGALCPAKPKAADPKASARRRPPPPPPEPPLGSLQAIASAYRLPREETTTCAMIYLFFMAGKDPDIQQAQVQWTSYRISFSMAKLKNPTNDAVLEAFLKSLGSNVSAKDRRTNANAALQSAQQLGVTDLPEVTEEFSDEGTTEEWMSWKKRCSNAQKPLGPAVVRQKNA